ncbi:Tripartite ATP-independent periplasmic transporter DctQ component [uncultured spirochete]|uniref:Tripartite ATP-independent periplasmic transporter DctQ component n=1 Tax=uncultured spirochete TaxID=156406 RepID=A0A3P3XQG8_9SPIR|nr:Tripartite ATP-independent periplasmic transporter DctQ component [uncultured spirochete]
MNKISTVLEKIIRFAVGVLLIVLSANVLLQILSREILHIQTVWTDEVARFSFIWMTMLGASLQVKKKSHFAVSLFSLKGTVRLLHSLLVYALMAVLMVVFIWFGYKYTIQGWSRYSTSSGIRMAWIFAAIPVGGLLMLFFIVELAIADIREARKSSISAKGGD